MTKQKLFTAAAVIGMVVIWTVTASATRIVSITTCTAISEPGTIPTGITDVFSTQAPEICAVAVLEGVVAGTVLTGTWVAVDAIETPNYIIDSAVVHVEQGGKIRARFAISRPNSGWPTGHYRFDFLIDGNLATSAPFSIGAGTEGTSSPASPPSSGGSIPSRQNRSQTSKPATAPSVSGLSGTYTYNDQGTTMTLVLQEGGNGQITGSLTSPDGWQMKVEGMKQEDAAVGSCYNDQGGYYFEAYEEKGGLTLNLIEPGPDNAPDYTKAQQLTFSRKGGGSSPAPSMPGRQSIGAGRPSTTTRTETPNLSGESIGDPGWGFVVHPPAGWKAQKTAQGVVMGHDAIAGMIVVFPHMMTDLQTVQAQMQSGLNEEGTQLSLTGGLQQLGDNAIAGDYAGTFNGQNARARGVGTLSPHGGGAYILAITTPEKYSGEIARAADAVAAGMEYNRPQTSDLMQAFAGTWVTMTTNTQRKVTLTPDGGYYENYEASYSGSSSDGLGNQGMAWGTARNDNAQGRWTARGNREQGVITITYPDGNTATVEYRVHVENGETYWNEYWFDGALYGRER